MSVLFPPRLAPGDVIGVTAPSAGVPEHLHPRLELAIKNLKKRGYQVREGRCLRSQHKNKSATKFSRVEELMSYLTDPDIKAGGRAASKSLKHEASAETVLHPKVQRRPRRQSQP